EQPRLGAQEARGSGSGPAAASHRVAAAGSRSPARTSEPDRGTRDGGHRGTPRRRQSLDSHRREQPVQHCGCSRHDSRPHPQGDRSTYRLGCGRDAGGQLTPSVTGALTAQAVADLVGGRLLGDGALELHRVRSLERAEANDLSVCAGNRWLPALESTRAGAVLLGPDQEQAAGPAIRIIVADPMQAIRTVAMVFAGEDSVAPGVDPTARTGSGAVIATGVRIAAHAIIGENALIGERCVIGAQVIIGPGVKLGNDVRIDPGVVIHAGAVLGNRVYIKARSVIGGPGFGFVSSA